MKKVLLLRATAEGVEFGELPFDNIKDRLQFYYEQLECSCIDIQEAYGLSIPADLVVDDEALLKEDYIMNPYASFAYGYLEHGQPIVGHALIVKPVPTRDGIEEGGFDDTELETIKQDLSRLAVDYIMKWGDKGD